MVKLHIEFQGPSSHEPMPLRMLDYMARLAKSDPDLDLSSVVFYVGQGAGATDKGEYIINGPDGKPTLQWRYHVIHLWKMKAEELLALHQPALLPLVGQTQIDHPKLVLPQVVDELKTVPDAMLRKRLFTGLLALMNEEEATQMIETAVLKLAVQAADLDTFQKGLQAQLSQQANQQTNGEKQ